VAKKALDDVLLQKKEEIWMNEKDIVQGIAMILSRVSRGGQSCNV
jgi:hypothetical protein